MTTMVLRFFFNFKKITQGVVIDIWPDFNRRTEWAPEVNKPLQNDEWLSTCDDDSDYRSN